MDEIHVVEHHYIKGGEGVSDKVNWRGKYEIKEYTLIKYKYIRYTRKMNYRKNKDYIVNPWELSYHGWLQEVINVLRKESNSIEKTVSRINDKHPSTYRSNVKKLSK